MIILLKLIKRIVKLMNTSFIMVLNALRNNYVLIVLLKLKFEFKKKRYYLYKNIKTIC